MDHEVFEDDPDFVLYESLPEAYLPKPEAVIITHEPITFQNKPCMLIKILCAPDEPDRMEPEGPPRKRPELRIVK